MEDIDETPQTKDFNVIDYIEKFQKRTVNKILKLSESGTEKDSVKLKANLAILSKLVPDRTKMELDMRNSAPYDLLKKHLEEKGE